MNSRNIKLYCDFCRGDDLPLIQCYRKKCKSSIHLECIQNKNNEFNSKEWLCFDCTNENEDSNNMETNKYDLSHHFICKKWTKKILENRQIFLKSIESSLYPFCKDLICSSKINKKNVNEYHDIQDSFIDLTETPTFITNVTIRNYQLDGISTLYNWYLRGVGGILGDEMGLGKTLQTITFLGCLKEKLGLNGPHLIITPVSVLQNWINELIRIAPSITFKKISGGKAEREHIFNNEKVLNGSYNIYLTTYETISNEEAFFTDSFPWATIIIDEGHKIKNENSILRKTLNRIRSPFRLLLTGTPLQNNMHELWALLNYILPDIFKDSTIFDKAVQVNEDQIDIDICTSARNLLENVMMIRRVKDDVETNLLPKIICKIYVNMSPLQIKLYKGILEKSDVQYFKSMLTMAQLLATLSQLNKVVNHPKQILNYRIKARVDENKRISNNYYAGSQYIQPKSYLLPPQPGTSAWKFEEELNNLKGELLIKSCGKLLMLDRLLLKLKAQGSRVLIFSQYIETLDILQEYFQYRFGLLGETFVRLDGSDNRIIRELNIRSFNNPNSKLFAFLLSTKACGMGINLATADSVILYDSSWNPQLDLQAMDRAHRIGQQKQVYVYRFLTRDTFEEKINEISERKLLLNHFMIANNHQSSLDQIQMISNNDNNNDYEEEEDIYGFMKINSKVTFTFSELSKALFHGKNFIYNTQESNIIENNLNQLGDNEVFAKLDAELDFIVQQSKEGIIIPADFETNTDIIEQDLMNMNHHSKESVEMNDQDDLLTHDIDQSIFMNFDIEESDSDNIKLNTNNNNNNINNKDKHLSNDKNDDTELSYNNDNNDSDDALNDITEESNYLPNRKRRAPSKYCPAMIQSKKTNRSRIHEDYCFSCADGGELIECMQCPKVYHIECLGYDEVPTGYWACPWHTCIECDRRSSTSGGILFRCITCPISYCFDCWPTSEHELKQIYPNEKFYKQFIKYGFDKPSNTSWVSCSECSRNMRNKTKYYIETNNHLKLISENEENRERNENKMKLSEEYKKNKAKKEFEMYEKLQSIQLFKMRQLEIREIAKISRNENIERKIMEKEEKIMKKYLKDEEIREKKRILNQQTLAFKNIYIENIRIRQENKLMNNEEKRMKIYEKNVKILEENVKRKIYFNEVNERYLMYIEENISRSIEKKRKEEEEKLKKKQKEMLLLIANNERSERILMRNEELNTISLEIKIKEILNTISRNKHKSKEYYSANNNLSLIDNDSNNKNHNNSGSNSNNHNNHTITITTTNHKKNNINNNINNNSNNNNIVDHNNLNKNEICFKNKKLTKNNKKTHDDYCFCCDDGGRLIECNKCPKVYHLSCLGYKKTPREKEWVCPCHECIYCDKSLDDNDNNNCTNVIYRCKYCPYSYCNDCIQSVSEKTKFDPLLEKYFVYHNYEKHHFEMPRNIKWIVCIDCLEENKSLKVEYS